jgi:hypothetical protein
MHTRVPFCGKPAGPGLIYSGKKNTPPVRTGSVFEKSTGCPAVPTLTSVQLDK